MSASAHRRLHDPKFLVGHWPLNGHAQDVSGHGNHGTWAGTEAYVAGPFSGHAVASLNGTPYVSCGNVVTNLAGEAYSVGCQFKPTSSIVTTQAITDKLYRYSIYITGSAITYQWFNGNPGGSSNLYQATSSVGLVLGSWVHVMLTFDGSGTLSCYANGALVASDSTATTSAGTPSTDTLGAGSAGGSRLTGLLANSRIYSCALSGDEVAALYEFDRR